MMKTTRHDTRHGSRRLPAGLLLASLLAATPALSAAPAPHGPAPLTIAGLYADQSIIGTSPEHYAWSADGTRLAFAWNDRGTAFRDVWVYEAATGVVQQVTHMGEAGRNTARGAGVTQLAWLPDGRVAFVMDGALRVTDMRGHVGVLDLVRHGVGLISPSPDGRWLAFVSDGALWLRDMGHRASTPARIVVPGTAQDGVDRVEWSPRSDRIAVVMADNRAVHKVEIDYDHDGQAHHDHVIRAFPGDPNTGFAVGVVDVAGGPPRWMPRENEQDPVWNFGLSPDGRSLFVNESDLVIKHHGIDVYDVTSGHRQVFYRFADPAQVRPDWQVAWAPRGPGLVLLTNRYGYNQLYHIPAAGAQPRPITRVAPGQGAWEIESFVPDPVHGQLYFTSNQAGYAQRQVYRVGMEGGTPELVTRTHGTHEVVFSPDFAHVADRFSNDSTPPELYVAALGSGTPSFARVTHSPLPQFASRRWADVRYLDYKSHVDGAQLTMRVMLPPDYDASRRYPMIVGSVYSDAVRDQWGGRNAHPTWGLDQYLVSRGYIVINPGIRGSFGRGKAWNRPMLGQYGTLDIDDLQDGARSMVARGYADPARIGIWGSSYGGLMTLMSLFRKPGFYAVGVAGAPASNVAHAYPEQEWIMGPPSGHDFPARYQRQSALYQTAGLRDPLMIIHGTRDEVVLYADTMAMAQRMIAQGKMFDLVTLPGANHPWDMENLPQTRFAYTQLARFLDRALHPEGGTTPAQ
ncbi:prolyl oligopeptidase family serine peptidase [Gluconacetobacter entanii]|uniref:Prolyl oligopeptidase family serine peptidase n=2 Tax=Gluconacetobacter entanii TaxID=108528 RepID=A0ABT3K5N7_9PROT|nr:prolyl oligopeptidase family serine peptidase [Gluconacetobacter entanii]MCW4590733.1 prolyl oligopeptidase family serine peptidase [Gluconacetobacter entanii]NPC89037.1 S9 family peptidase [Gluconacetobacter entanii]